jgi:hypothetical protein
VTQKIFEGTAMKDTAMEKLFNELKEQAASIEIPILLRKGAPTDPRDLYVGITRSTDDRLPTGITRIVKGRES